MIAEMFAYYKTHGVSLLERLDELYRTYGYRLNTLHSYEFDRESGLHKMQDIMKKFHAGVDEFGGKKVEKVFGGLPKLDALKYLLEGNSSVVVRPSGTVPKLKVYISVRADNIELAEKKEERISKQVAEFIEKKIEREHEGSTY